MIVIGYQGIGKSTVAQSNAVEGCYAACIRPECFRLPEGMMEGYEKVLKNISEHLKNQHISIMVEVDEYFSRMIKAKNTVFPAFIDLESGNFWVNGERNYVWYMVYAKIAMELSKQGFVVFTSSHEVVRTAFSLYLNEEEYKNEKVLVVHPSYDLKDQWIERLESRYEASGLDKDYRALMNAKDRYEENIKELEQSPFDTAIIKSMDYELFQIIADYLY